MDAGSMTLSVPNPGFKVAISLSLYGR